MPNQVMCVARLASIEFERSNPRFKTLHGRLIFSQIQDKAAEVRAVVGIHPLATRLVGAGSHREVNNNTPEGHPGVETIRGRPMHLYHQEGSKMQRTTQH